VIAASLDGVHGDKAGIAQLLDGTPDGSIVPAEALLPYYRGLRFSADIMQEDHYAYYVLMG